MSEITVKFEKRAMTSDEMVRIQSGADSAEYAATRGWPIGDMMVEPIVRTETICGRIVKEEIIIAETIEAAQRAYDNPNNARKRKINTR